MTHSEVFKKLCSLKNSSHQKAIVIWNGENTHVIDEPVQTKAVVYSRLDVCGFKEVQFCIGEVSGFPGIERYALWYL
jgi:hypothetical protein